ncbi:MAG: tetratricopeptide repeat protein, partial [Bdellovibrionales bacterium]|nr:tetratricopeptide repeat protein [Bdellovibrionales bacterium]
LAGQAADGSLSALEKKLAAEPDNIKVRMQLAAEMSRQEGQESKIVEILNPYADEITLESQLTLAGAYNGLKKFKDEVRVLKKVVEKAPTNHEAYYILGYAHLNSKEQVDAVASFRRAIKLSKTYRDAYEALLLIFEKAGDNYESRIVLKDMLKQFGKDPSAVSHLCRLDSSDGYLDSAIMNCQKAIKMDPKKPDNHVYLAQSLSDKKNESKAGRVLINASKKYPKSEFVQWAAGQYYFKQSNFPVAAKYFNRAVTADEKSARAHLGFALSVFEQKKYDQALGAFMSACEIDESVLEKLREAQGKLRSVKEDDWSKRYSREVYECKKRRNEKAKSES